jgi:hypothetical protein
MTCHNHRRQPVPGSWRFLTSVTWRGEHGASISRRFERSCFRWLLNVENVYTSLRTRRHKPQDLNLEQRRCEHLKCGILSSGKGHTGTEVCCQFLVAFAQSRILPISFDMSVRRSCIVTLPLNCFFFNIGGSFITVEPKIPGTLRENLSTFCCFLG